MRERDECTIKADKRKPFRTEDRRQKGTSMMIKAVRLIERVNYFNCFVLILNNEFPLVHSRTAHHHNTHLVQDKLRKFIVDSHDIGKHHVFWALSGFALFYLDEASTPLIFQFYRLQVKFYSICEINGETIISTESIVFHLRLLREANSSGLKIDTQVRFSHPTTVARLWVRLFFSR